MLVWNSIGMDKNYLLGNLRLAFCENYEGAYTHTYLCINISKFPLLGKSAVQLNDNLEFQVSGKSFIIAFFTLECLFPDWSFIPQ